jgi:hypothetical protein
MRTYLKLKLTLADIVISCPNVSSPEYLRHCPALISGLLFVIVQVVIPAWGVLVFASAERQFMIQQPAFAVADNVFSDIFLWDILNVARTFFERGDG